MLFSFCNGNLSENYRVVRAVMAALLLNLRMQGRQDVRQDGGSGDPYFGLGGQSVGAL